MRFTIITPSATVSGLTRPQAIGAYTLALIEDGHDANRRGLHVHALSDHARETALSDFREVAQGGRPHRWSRGHIRVFREDD